MISRMLSALLYGLVQDSTKWFYLALKLLLIEIKIVKLLILIT